MSDTVEGHDGAALFLVRAWLEPASERPLRARVRCTTDLAHGIEHESTVADPDELVDVLRRWIDDLYPPDQR